MNGHHLLTFPIDLCVYDLGRKILSPNGKRRRRHPIWETSNDNLKDAFSHVASAAVSMYVHRISAFLMTWGRQRLHDSRGRVVVLIHRNPDPEIEKRLRLEIKIAFLIPLGDNLENVWYTSIIAFGREYAFSLSGIECCQPVRKMMSPPTYLESSFLDRRMSMRCW